MMTSQVRGCHIRIKQFSLVNTDIVRRLFLGIFVSLCGTFHNGYADSQLFGGLQNDDEEFSNAQSLTGQSKAVERFIIIVTLTHNGCIYVLIKF